MYQIPQQSKINFFFQTTKLQSMSQCQWSKRILKEVPSSNKKGKVIEDDEESNKENQSDSVDTEIENERSDEEEEQQNGTVNIAQEVGKWNE